MREDTPKKILKFKIPINTDTILFQSIIQKNTFDSGAIQDKSQNIVVTKKGASEKIIIVGAHYDSVGTHGADDNASGAATVLESALRLVDVDTPYTIRYIFFGAEEIGLLGSSTYLKNLTQEEIDNIVLMINVDCVLAGDIMYLHGGQMNGDGIISDIRPVQCAYEICQELGLEIESISEGDTVYPFPTKKMISDYAPFSYMGIPYICCEANYWAKGYAIETKGHSIIMHTENDDLDFLNEAYMGRAQNTLKSYTELLVHLLQSRKLFDAFDEYPTYDE